jgi:hypothetical protein
MAVRLTVERRTENGAFISIAMAPPDPWAAQVNIQVQNEKEDKLEAPHCTSFAWKTTPLRHMYVANVEPPYCQ